MLKYVTVLIALSTLLLVGCGNRDNSKAFSDTTPAGGDGPGTNTNSEPNDCEVPGETFGIVSGTTLSLNNPLSESTVLLLHQNSRTSEVALCTGTLIDNDKILTAAHCIEKDGAGHTTVAFTNSAHCGMKAQTRTMRPIIAQVFHEDYVHFGDTVKNAANDIAILKFSGTFPPGYKVRELPSSTEDLKDVTELIMSGYGTTHEDDNDSLGTLRFTRTPKTRLSTSYYSTREEHQIFLQNVHVIDQYDRGVCAGDSGGPLYAWNGEKLILIGVTSAGVDNRSSGRFALRPRVCHGVSLFADLRAKLGLFPVNGGMLGVRTSV